MSAAMQAIENGKARGEFNRAIAPKLHTDLPDSDQTVLMVTTDQEFPVWPGFHDGEQWCCADATTLEGVVLGWVEFNDAATVFKTLPKAP